MKIASFYLIVAGLLISAFIQSATATSGTATYYTVYTPSACYGYDDQGKMIAAANDAIYSNGAACGTFYIITCKNSTNQGGSCKSGTSVTVKIVDLCPSCADNQFDLSEQAFSQIAYTGAGRIHIHYNNTKTLRTFRTSPEVSPEARVETPPSDIPITGEEKDSSGGKAVIGIAIILITLASIVAFSVCYVVTKKKITKKLRRAVAPIAAPPFFTTVEEVDSPTIERFLEENKKPTRFTAQQLCAFTSNYSTKLGFGGFGVVYKGEFPNGYKIAVKILKKNLTKKNDWDQFMAEVGTLGRTYHINLVKLYGYCYDPYLSALVFEYLENGSLDKYLFDETQVIEWERLCDIAMGTARGLAYLHEECPKRIIHYDIKPENILLDVDFLAKVADFGLAKFCNRDDTHDSLTGYRGTPGYSAPEIYFKNFPITHKCDVYSFGMVLFEIVGRRRNTIEGGSNDSFNWFPKQVWDGYEKGELSNITMGCGIEEEHKEEAEKMFLIALWCVQDSPEARPPMSVVVKMLEGEMEIVPPPKPFQYLYPIGTNPAPTSNYSNVEDSNTS